MTLIPDVDRILLGPGPSLTAPRVMRAMAAPTLSHLDPLFMQLLDDVRVRLLRTFRAAEHSFAFAVSGTGTSGMETVVANLIREGTRATVVVGGYFSDRLVQMCERYGATVSRLDVEWGRACDPEALRRHLKANGADVVAMVHAETSTGVCNSVRELAAIAREHGALTIVDAVTSLGGMPLDVGAWGIDACYSCTQKCLGGPSGLAPVVFGPRALERRAKCRSFYFDLGLLEDYWLRRKYHHTMSSTLVYALYESLAIIEEEGLDARWSRHERNHRSLVAALSELGLSLLPAESDRLWTLNAVRVPAAVDEAAVRTQLLEQFNIEIGAGLGPLAGKIWRIGLMGASSSPRLIVLLRGALESALARQGHRVTA
jgi:alanine-glyoxylate transaminase/serine-glyoxylate transaminase/serine-pyruvate transaminase